MSTQYKEWAGGANQSAGATRARWLPCIFVPFLALSLLLVDDMVQALAWNIGGRARVAEFAVAGRLLGSLVGPLVTAAIFAYPVARLYPHAVRSMSLLICLPTIASAMPFLALQTLDVIAVYVVALIALVSLLPAASWLVSHRVIGLLRVVALSPPGSAFSRSSGECEDACGQLPLALRLIMLPLVAAALFVVHNWIEWTLLDLAFKPGSRQIQLVGMMVAAFLGPLITALLFAYPTVLLYGKSSKLAALIMCVPVSLHWAATYLVEAKLPWWIAANVSIVVLLASLLPLAAGLVRAHWQRHELILVLANKRAEPNRG